MLLQKLSNKLLERCPLQYSVVRNLICLDPKYIANSPESAVSKCSNLLQHLITKKLKSPDSSDTVLKQYKSLVSNVQKYDKDDFKSYRPSDDKRLDSFLYEKIGEKTEYAELWELVKEMLTLSHCQSSVERGFFENNNILQTNMKEEPWCTFGKQWMVSGTLIHLLRIQ